MSLPQRTVHVALGERSYAIEIGTGNLRDAGRFLMTRRKVSHSVIITDANVENRHAMSVAESLSDADMLVDLLVVDPGEASKCAEVLEGLWNKLLDLGADRREGRIDAALEAVARIGIDAESAAGGGRAQGIEVG